MKMIKNKIDCLLISVFIISLSACGKPDLNQTPPHEANTRETQAKAENPLPEDPSAKDSELRQNVKVSDTQTQEKPICLNIDKPFCKVFESEGDCDPKLIEYHYKAGDQLYWINHTQYDTVECYYTEEEYNQNHDPKDCSEIQDNGKGCIIDDAPDCNLMLNGDDCTVSPTKAYCDERLLELNKNIGDRLPGIWIEKDKKIECFYTKEERNQFLKKNKLKCNFEYKDMNNICIAIENK